MKRSTYRAMPADFAKCAKNMLVKDVMAHWGVCKFIAVRWRKEAGFAGIVHSASRRPELTVEQIQHLTDTMTQEAAAEAVGVCNTTFRKMQREAGVAIPQTRTLAKRRVRADQIARNRLEIPADFLEYLGGHSQEDTADHFGINISTVQRWARQLGFERAAPLPTVRTNAPPPEWWAAAAPSMTRDEACLRAGVGYFVIARWAKETGVRCKPCRGITFGRRQQPQPPKVDMSLAGRAADYLRSRWPSYRCDKTGKQDINGDHWRFGSAILTGDEVVARAERRGFDPHAWARLAA